MLFIEMREADDVDVLILDDDDVHIIEIDECDEGHVVILDVEDVQYLVTDEQHQTLFVLVVLNIYTKNDEVQYLETDEVVLIVRAIIDVELPEVLLGDEYMIYDYMQNAFQIIEVFIEIETNDATLDELDEQKCILYIRVLYQIEQ